jgi:hypothetical protein
MRECPMDRHKREFKIQFSRHTASYCKDEDFYALNEDKKKL